MRYAIPGLRRLIRGMAPAVVVSSEAGLNLCTLIAVRTLPRRKPAQARVARGRQPVDRAASRSLSAEPHRLPNFTPRLPLCRSHHYAHRRSAARSACRISRSPTTIDLRDAHQRGGARRRSADRLARWDGETGRDDDLIVCVGRLSPEKDQRDADPGDDLAAGRVALASRHRRRRRGTTRARGLRAAATASPIASFSPVRSPIRSPG